MTTVHSGEHSISQSISYTNKMSVNEGWRKREGKKEAADGLITQHKGRGMVEQK